MATVVILPHATYDVGTRTVGPASVPTGVAKAALALDRAEWLAGSTLSLQVDLSLDGGATWNSPHPDVDPFPAGLTAVGGVALDKNGVPYLQTILTVPVPQPTNPNRQVRATITIAGGPMTTTGTLTLT